jgi:hypothetical protein
MKINNLSRMGVYSALMAVSAIGCKNNPETFFSTQTDRYTAHLSDNYEQASQLLQADYMFVLDYSYSMSQGSGNTSKIQNLLNSMPGFVQQLQTQGIDYKIGVVKGTVHANNQNEIATNFFGEIISRDTTSDLLNSILGQLSPAGLPLSENTNYLLEAAKRAISSQSSTFLREGSQAVYILVSDSDDRSHQNSEITGNKTAEGYGEFLRSTKNHFSYVSARSIVAGIGENCELQNSYDDAGTRIAIAARTADSQATPANCIYRTFDENLADLARNVTRPTLRFTLRGQPVPSSVRVFVNNTEVAQSAWSYKPTTNEVVFANGQAPAFDARLEITYEQLFVLKSAPKLNSINITINGRQLESSEFRFIESENRIEFSSASLLQEGDDVRVTYQAK